MAAGKDGFGSIKILDTSVEDYDVVLPSPFLPPQPQPLPLPSATVATSFNGDQGTSKPSKLRKKKQDGPKHVFLLKSEVDKVDDGYRWALYGRKAIKGTPYSKNYYRCTTPDCGVRKTIERSVKDPETVVTTYVGIHTHVVPGESAINHNNTSGGSGGDLSAGGFQAQQQQEIPDLPPIPAPYHEQQQPMMMPPPFDFEYLSAAGTSATSSFTIPTSSDSAGLLEDMLPSHLRRNDMI